jgi:hypothetical protein
MGLWSPGIDFSPRFNLYAVVTCWRIGLDRWNRPFPEAEPESRQAAMQIHVSPHFIVDTGIPPTVTSTVDPPLDKSALQFENPDLWIRIFQDRMDGWFFDVANVLIERDKDVAAVHIVTPLIEALEERYRGKSSKDCSKEFFKERAKKILALPEEGIEVLYGGLRSGFAHHGFLKDDTDKYNILLERDRSTAAEFIDGVLWIVPERYVQAIRHGYEVYYNEVRTKPGMKDKFGKLWEKDWQMSLRVPGSGGTLRSRSVAEVPVTLKPTARPPG